MLLPSRFPHSWSAPMTRRRPPFRWRRAASPSSCTPRPLPYPLPGSRPAARQARSCLQPRPGPPRPWPPRRSCGTRLASEPRPPPLRRRRRRRLLRHPPPPPLPPPPPAATATSAPSSTATSGTTSAAGACSAEPDRATRSRQRRQEPPSHRAPRQAAWQALAWRPMRRAGGIARHRHAGAGVKPGEESRQEGEGLEEAKHEKDPKGKHDEKQHGHENDPRGEGVEVVAGLPEVDDSPATIDRPRCLEEKPLRWCAIGVGVIVSVVELLLSDP